MKNRIWLSIIMLCACAQLSAQNLRLADIQSMLKCATWQEVNVRLLNKGWNYSGSTPGQNEGVSMITWSYEENAYTEKAKGWFKLYTYNDVPARATYQLVDNAIYNSTLNTVVSSGYKLVRTDILENEIRSEYESASWIVTFVKSKQDEDFGTKTYNIIEVMPKGSYFDPDNGEVELVLNDSTIYKATIKNGKTEGEVIYTDFSGNVKERANYKNDKREGACKVYDKNGRVINEGNYKSGLLHGKWLEYEYDAYGQKTATYYTNYKENVENGDYYQKLLSGSQRGTYVNGKRQGALEEYNRVGRLTFKTTMNQDSLDGTTFYYIWNSSGICLDTLFATYKMGALDGPCEFWYGDEYIEGGFKNNQLNGYCKLYKNEDLLIGDEMRPGSLFFISAEGNYLGGKRVGNWKEYSFGNLRYEGEYVNGMKNGGWKTYATTYQMGDQVHELITYQNGLRNGPCKSYFDLDYERCADSTPGCFRLKKTDNPIEGAFLNDMSDGYWVKKDSVGKVLWSGSYLLDKKTGVWKYNETADDGEVYTTIVNYKAGVEEGATSTTSSTRGLLWQANYLKGKLSGPVTKYFPGNPDLEECKMNYVAGEFSGEYVWTDRVGNEISGTYSRNRISSCVVSDTNGKILYSLEHIVLFEGTTYTSTYIVETDTGTISQQIFYDIGISYDSIMPYSFLWNFEDERDHNRLTHTGAYTFTHNGVVVAAGQKVSGKKTGVWEYKYNPEVTWKVAYSENGISDEYFITSLGAFSGKYRATFPGNNESVMFKIEESRRDGKSEYVREGKTYRKEKYKKGVLQN